MSQSAALALSELMLPAHTCSAELCVCADPHRNPPPLLWPFPMFISPIPNCFEVFLSSAPNWKTLSRQLLRCTLHMPSTALVGTHRNPFCSRTIYSTTPTPISARSSLLRSEGCLSKVQNTIMVRERDSVAVRAVNFCCVCVCVFLGNVK